MLVIAGSSTAAIEAPPTVFRVKRHIRMGSSMVAGYGHALAIWSYRRTAASLRANRQG